MSEVFTHTQRDCATVAQNFYVLVMDNARIIVLVLLYVCGMTAVNIMHTGYILFAVFFFLYPSLMIQYWRALVLYTSVATCALFAYQLLCEPSFFAFLLSSLVWSRPLASFPLLSSPRNSCPPFPCLCLSSLLTHLPAHSHNHTNENDNANPKVSLTARLKAL